MKGMKRLFIVIFIVAASVVMGAAAPSVGAGFSPNAPTTTDTVNFFCTVTGAGPFTYSWTGQDGVTGTFQSVTHRYTTAGRYTASVTVTDSLSQSSMASVTITVTDGSTPPPPPPPTPGSKPVINEVMIPAMVVGASGSFAVSYVSTGTLSSVTASFDGGPSIRPTTSAAGSATFTSPTYACPAHQTVTFTVMDSNGSTFLKSNFAVEQSATGLPPGLNVNFQRAPVTTTGSPRRRYEGVTVKIVSNDDLLLIPCVRNGRTSSTCKVKRQQGQIVGSRQLASVMGLASTVKEDVQKDEVNLDF